MFRSKLLKFLLFFFPKIRKFCQNSAEFSPNLTKFFRDFSKMQQLSEAFRRYQGGTKGSVPVPSDAACAQMFPFLASSSARPAGRSPRPNVNRTSMFCSRQASRTHSPPALFGSPGDQERKSSCAPVTSSTQVTLSGAAARLSVPGLRSEVNNSE